jgi:zinc protease
MLTAALLLAACATDPQDAPDIGYEVERSSCADETDCLNRGAHTSHVAGIRVIHKRIAGEPIVAMRIGFDGGAARWTPRQAYAEQMLVTIASWWGSLDRLDSWDEDLARIGASFSAYSGVDYADYALQVPAVHFQEGWSMLTSAVLQPPIPDDLGHLREVQANAYKTAEDEAEGAAAAAAWRLFAPGHPYRMRLDNVPALDSVITDDVYDAYDAMARRDRMTVVVVGDVERERVEQLVGAGFAELAAGDHAALPEVPAFVPQAQRSQIIDRPDSPTWHIVAYFAAPRATDPDFAALELGLEALSSRLFDEVRSERALVYSIDMAAHNFRRNFGTLSLATEHPVAAMQAVHAVIDDVLANGIDTQQLDAQRALARTGVYAANQTPSNIAATLLDWQLTSGDRAAIDTNMARLDAVSSEDVRRVLAKYLTNLRYGAAGSGDALAESDLVGNGDSPAR